MAHVESHAPGTFCWLELGTTDQNAAKSFYGSLFGWTALDSPMGPDEIYTMFQLDGRNAGACYQLMPSMVAQGVPPHWMLYVCVPDADLTAAKAQTAGGKVLNGPFDVMDFGRMAVIQDPTGGVISVWQPKTHPGTTIEEVPGTMCWADLMSPDQERAVRFYNEVFGWRIEAGQSDTSGYLHIAAGDKMIGGMPPSKYLPAGVPAHWITYIAVDNCDASTAKAVNLGGRTCMPPTTMEGVGRWSVIADPQGAAFCLFQPLPRH